MRIGIMMGGSSREREISFAGGRTVYDNLDKSRYTPVPLFVDSFRNVVKLNWQLLYKGSIRDFSPSPTLLQGRDPRFQYYAEQLGPLSDDIWQVELQRLGRPLKLEDLRTEVDFVFLTLHGESGEDGSIQGLLQWLGIPYSGSGITGSALGYDKLTLRHLLEGKGFATPRWTQLSVAQVLADAQAAANRIQSTVPAPCVVKHPTQGSSIGVQIVKEPDQLPQALRQAAFLHTLEPEPDAEHRLSALRVLADPRTGIGLPAWVTQMGRPLQLVHGPDELDILWAAATAPLQLQAVDSPEQLLVEEFIVGTEFSVIVLEDTHGCPLALPPTEILKLDELFDYRAKYLPGIARKRTPIELPEHAIRNICQQAEQLKDAFFFEVYARLDGILAQDGTVYFNDPNTTSGMLPSSFFFHQAAEIGLSPTGLLTYIIETSLRKPRIHRPGQYAMGPTNAAVSDTGPSSATHRLRVGVLLGGYSTERHISAESGRNIYEKLSASTDFEPLPVFVLHNRYLPEPLRSRLDAEAPFSLWQIPVRLLLKDNADDIAKLIAQSVSQPLAHPVVEEIRQRAAEIRARFGLDEVPQPLHLPFAGLGGQLDFAFIALHGRPGEDGQLQTLLEAAGVPYNGSGVPSSQITIDKYRTNELLQAAGLPIPRHYLVDRHRYTAQPEAELDAVEQLAPYPLIAKPSDEGCSSAVLKIRNREQLKTYLQAAFRAEETLSDSLQAALHLRPTDPFPAKDQVLVEELVQARAGQRLMEITVGLVTRLDAAGRLIREIFEPSETPSQSEVLSLEEKFLAGEGQNITPARFSPDPELQAHISQQVRATIARAAEVLNIEGYCRIDAFVRLGPAPDAVEVVFIEVNSLPGMTPATCIFHQTALAQMTPLDFIRQIIHFGRQRAGKVAL